jgi:hypothetical protein
MYRISNLNQLVLRHPRCNAMMMSRETAGGSFRLNAAEADFVEVDYPVQEEEFPLSVVTLEVKASHDS